ncbi:MAG TPA: 3-phosphoshikimate 1-carboxyvinyltransferase [Nitrososphaera sp.]
MVSIVVEKSKLNGIIRCPSSKSYSHRAIAIASLACGMSTITNILLARDTLATLTACSALGAKIKYEGTLIKVRGTSSLHPPENILNADNSGTTMRLVTAISGLVKNGYTILTGDQSLRKRPMQPMLDALGQLGVHAYSTRQNGMPPLIVKGGGIKGGSTVIDGSISSQFISGLLIASTCADSKILIKVKGDLVSKPYIDATLAAMSRFGVTIDHSPNMREFYTQNVGYHTTKFDIPGDFSTAALLLAAGALVGDKLKVRGLSFTLPQGDSGIISILRNMGCLVKVDEENGEVTVEGSEVLEGGSFDLSDTPDLLPVISILALKTKNPVVITGVAHARLKETDRISNIAKELVKLGARVKEFRDGLKIASPSRIRNASLEAYNDHRLFMAFAIASMLTKKSMVAGAEAVDVSFPNFLAEMKDLGARISPAPDRE